MQKYLVQLVDDISGEEATESIRFALDGSSYAIDLNGSNAAKLRAAFEPYLNAARKSAAQAPTRGKLKGAPKDLEAMREWLRGQGHTVSSRGRIPNSLMQEYEAAH